VCIRTRGKAFSGKKIQRKEISGGKDCRKREAKINSASKDLGKSRKGFEERAIQKRSKRGGDFQKLSKMQLWAQSWKNNKKFPVS